MVNKTSVLIRSFLKKSFAQVIALIVLILFSSLLLNVFLFVQFDYEDNFYKTSEKLESEDISIVYYNLFDVDKKDNVIETLESLDYITGYEIERIISGSGSIDFNGGELDNFISLCSYSEIKNKKIGEYEILNDINSEGVILSYLFKVSGGYNVGDKISFRINESKYEYNIIGFYNNVTTGTINCPDIMIVLTDDLFNEIKGEENPSVRIEANVKEDFDNNEILNKVVSKLEENVPELVYLYGNDLQDIKSNRYSNATLFKVILSAASIVMIIVMLIIIFITLSNYIRNTTKDLGTLKSIGYTSKNLIRPIVIALTLISTVFSLVGAGLSYLVLPIINTALESQIGIPYLIEFQLMPFLLSVISISFVTYITTYFSVIKIKNIAPINAIRENRATTTKASRIVTLEKTNIGVNSLIGLKGFFASIGRNIVILIAITAVSFLAGFTCFMYQNVIKDNSYVLELICGQIADSTITVDKTNEEMVKDELEENEDVESFYLYTVSSIRPKDYPLVNTYIFEESSYLNSKTILLDGRFPNKNEIAINGAYAKNNNLKINDKIVVELEGDDLSLTISGITQGAYYAGNDSFILRETFEQTDDLYTLSYYINLKDNVDIDDFNNEIYNKTPRIIKNYINQDKYLQSTAAMYSSILYVLAAVICLLSLLIIIVVLYILIYILLRNKRREHGILKSLGYTSNEIIYQTILTITPTCFVAIVIGLLFSRNGVKDLLSYALQSIGIFSFGRSIQVEFLVVAGAFLIIFTIVYTLVLSLSIKRIAPHDLFNNE